MYTHKSVSIPNGIEHPANTRGLDRAIADLRSGVQGVLEDGVSGVVSVEVHVEPKGICRHELVTRTRKNNARES